MKAMKLAAVVTMLLASSVFGAVSLGIDAPGKVGNTITVDATNAAALTITLLNPDALNLNGFSLKGTSSTAGAVTITGRTPLDSVIKDPTVAAVGSKFIESVPDLGLTANAGEGKTAASIPVMTLTLQVAADKLPQTLTLWGSWNSADFDEGAIAQTTVTLAPVPEPASMMLIAAGAAFFARRRRVA